MFRLPTETGDEITSRLRKHASEKKGNSLEDRFQHLYSLRKAGNSLEDRFQHLYSLRRAGKSLEDRFQHLYSHREQTTV